MRLSRWMLLIGVLVGLGCLRVAQQHAVVLKSYTVGERTTQLHEQHNEVTWLNARIAGLVSPAHLDDIVQERRMNLVAWSMLESKPAVSFAARQAHGVGEVPAEERGWLLADGDTSD